MSSKLPITEADIQAYVDARHAQDRRAEIEDYLAAHPDAAQRAAAYREQNEQLHALFDPVLDETVPERLSVAPPAATGAKPERGGRFEARRFASVVAWIALGGLLGWTLHEFAPTASKGSLSGPTPSAPGAQSFVHGAALAHATYVPEKRHAVEVTADQEAHLVQWLSKRLGAPLRVPVLTEQGYALVGGRMLPGETGPAAQFMYEDPRGGRLTLYLKAGGKDKDTAFRFAEERGVGVFYWVDGDFGYALSGTLEKPRLLEIAKAVYGQVKQ
ncbi:MAG: anti-sigma factor [Usitatibacteraceae bacterium]